ncbi:MAG: hypothetical protein JWO86_583 [Myxococcaceae bacterium]|nr:hypothetical protein [Myxococcaceae bacterium]MEA2747942.1 hypothetical protein [Myxococcales bacterium]
MWLFAMVLGACLWACMGPTFIVQQYGGPVRPRETIATLRVNGSDSVHLITLDDEDVRAPLESDSRLHIEILPGRHKIGVSNGGPNDPVEPVAFVAEANKVYRAVYVAGVAHVVEVDRGGDAQGRDVTAPLAPPPAPATPAPTPIAPLAPPPVTEP